MAGTLNFSGIGAELNAGNMSVSGDVNVLFDAATLAATSGFNLAAH